eukprot:g6423.t1
MAPRKMVHGGHDLVRMRKPEVVPPVLRVGQELQQWQSQQQQLWQSQQQQMPQWKWQVQQLQVQEPRGAARSARSAESARDHGNGAGGAVTLRSHRADPSDKVEHSLLKLQKIQQRPVTLTTPPSCSSKAQAKSTEAELQNVNPVNQDPQDLARALWFRQVLLP